MNKKFKATIFIISVFFAGFLFFNNYSFAQQCQLNSAFWDKQSVTVGESVNMNVTGQNCNGQEVSFNIYEDDSFLTGFNDYLGTVKATFTNSSSITVGKTFSQADYQAGQETAEGSEEEVFFEAVVGDSSVKSENLILSPSTAGGPVGPGGPSPGPGETVTVSIEIPNPIQAESLVDLAKAIGKFLLQIAIPIAVIIIIYAGLLYLTSGGNREKIAKATTVLKYAVIGLAIILIGQGFFTLIKSILNLGGPTTP